MCYSIIIKPFITNVQHTHYKTILYTIWYSPPNIADPRCFNSVLVIDCYSISRRENHGDLYIFVFKYSLNSLNIILFTFKLIFKFIISELTLRCCIGSKFASYTTYINNIKLLYMPDISCTCSVVFSGSCDNVICERLHIYILHNHANL